MINTFDYFIFGFGLLLSGFFSGSEAVLMSISIDRVKQLIEEGDRRGKVFEYMSKRPTEFLTTILVGNNIVNIFVASLATTLAAKVFEDSAIAISVGVTTFFILIFGEIIPKTFARAKAESLAYPTIIILRFFYYILSPVVIPLSYIIQTLLGKNAQLNGKVVTKDDIEFMVNQAEKEQSIDSKQINLLNSILEFPKIKVKDIMIPRNKIFGFSDDTELSEIMDKVREVAHTRYPVYSGSMDNVIGFLHVKDLALVSDEQRKNFTIDKFVKEPFFVYENMKINAVFDHMNRKKVHLAIVKDENSVVVGVVTLEDIMEEIFGEIQDEHDDENDGIPKATDVSPEGFTVPGTINLRDLNSEYGIKIPLHDNYSTLTGFILEMIQDNFPKEGQIIIFEQCSFEVSKVNGSEIIEVMVKNFKTDED